MVIYKIFRAAEWAELQSRGWTNGAPVDLADGFIHFSTAAQLAETAAKHFAGEDGLTLAAVEADPLGDALAWEVSRGGDRFPHLYRTLELADIAWTAPLPHGSAGHVLPEGLR